MNQPSPVWLAVVGPVATLLGTMLVVMLGVYLQNQALERAVDLLRAEIREHIAGLKLEVLTTSANSITAWNGSKSYAD
jgi:hypothetical protein